MQHDLVVEPFEHVDGWVYPPTRPGLGIDVIEEVVDRYRSEGVGMTWSIGAGLEGRGVIVTGAAGGIGRAVAEAFATTGARVMAVDLDQAEVDEVVDGLEGSGHIGVALDLSDLRRPRAR